MAKTSAIAMARSVGIDPNVFRRALSEQNFPWRPVEGGWIVEADSPEHIQMIAVLRVIFAGETQSTAKSPETKRRAPAKRKSPAKKTVAKTKSA